MWRRTVKPKVKRRCYQCGGPFGLVRQAIGLKQFCKKICKRRYEVDLQVEMRRRKSWYEFLTRPT